MNETRPEEEAACFQASDEASPCCNPATSNAECGTPAAADCCAPVARPASRARMLIFLLVMGAAVAVLARGLAKESDATTDTAQQPFAAVSPAGSSDDASLANTARQAEGSALPETTAKSESPDGTASALCGPTLDSIASLNKLAADKDAVFVLLPGQDRRRAQTVSRQIEATVAKIQSYGRRIGTFTLEQNASDHARVVKAFAITSLPCVVAMGKGCGSAVVSDEITEAKLLQAFVAASRPRSSCAPTGCAPVGCK